MQSANVLPGTLLRDTQTGAFRTVLLLTDGSRSIFVDGGDLINLPAGSIVLAIVHDGYAAEVVERLMDHAELMMHAGFSAKVNGRAIRTVYDIRMVDPRQDVGEDPIPF